MRESLLCFDPLRFILCFYDLFFLVLISMSMVLPCKGLFLVMNCYCFSNLSWVLNLADIRFCFRNQVAIRRRPWAVRSSFKNVSLWSSCMASVLAKVFAKTQWQWCNVSLHNNWYEKLKQFEAFRQRRVVRSVGVDGSSSNGEWALRCLRLPRMTGANSSFGTWGEAF